MSVKKPIEEQFAEIDNIMNALCDEYPDLHLLLVFKVEGGSLRGIVGNYCFVCAKDQLQEFIINTNAQHNSEEKQESKNLAFNVSKLKH